MLIYTLVLAVFGGFFAYQARSLRSEEPVEKKRAALRLAAISAFCSAVFALGAWLCGVFALPLVQKICFLISVLLYTVGFSVAVYRMKQCFDQE